MSGFSNFATAASFKDAIVRMVDARIEKVRPSYRYARVVFIDREIRKCIVRYNGDPEEAQVPIPMCSVQPMEPGQVVRIEGKRGDKFIAAVLGPSYFEGEMGGEGGIGYSPTGYEDVVSDGSLTHVSDAHATHAWPLLPKGMYVLSVTAATVTSPVLEGIQLKITETVTGQSAIFYPEVDTEGDVSGHLPVVLPPGHAGGAALDVVVQERGSSGEPVEVFTFEVRLAGYNL